MFLPGSMASGRLRASPKFERNELKVLEIENFLNLVVTGVRTEREKGNYQTNWGGAVPGLGYLGRATFRGCCIRVELVRARQRGTTRTRVMGTAPLEKSRCALRALSSRNMQLRVKAVPKPTAQNE